jgi:hypothetical protein
MSNLSLLSQIDKNPLLLRFTAPGKNKPCGIGIALVTISN